MIYKIWSVVDPQNRIYIGSFGISDGVCILLDDWSLFLKRYIVNGLFEKAKLMPLIISPYFQIEEENEIPKIDDAETEFLHPEPVPSDTLVFYDDQNNKIKLETFGDVNHIDGQLATADDVSQIRNKIDAGIYKVVHNDV